MPTTYTLVVRGLTAEGDIFEARAPLAGPTESITIDPDAELITTTTTPISVTIEAD